MEDVKRFFDNILKKSYVVQYAQVQNKLNNEEKFKIFLTK